MNDDHVSETDPLDAVVEAYLQRHRRGEQPALTEYTERYPELAERLREIVPALLMLEEAGSVDEAAGPLLPTGADPPRQLGDYRILREVGRGGMGIVYEAVQESLGRHVALKVLPQGAARRQLYLERFQREARAVAQLHHTNIVPVFGVGEENGAYYYAMQFIQGQGLDVVIEDVKRLRGQSASSARAPDVTVHYGYPGLAQTLLTGDFQLGAAAPATEAVVPASVPPASTTGNRSDLSDPPGDRYHRRVAMLGAQVADALAHAHGMGVLHRDIKPSNLMLDAQGTVWVTDFGLAKAAESEDLTRTGDIFGTIRYMAPERFQGQSDARSDIYSLGVTLYELLALRPPFTAADRAGLMGQISDEAPPPPLGRWVERLPRDLETIVHKAMAREPAARYASAADLADDLRRFLENRPIKARRVSSAERFRRWCRRNPATAALASGVLVLLVFLAVGSTLSAFWLQHERNAAVVARNDAVAATNGAIEARNQARDQEEAKTEKLYQSYVDRAKASRYSRRPGQRFGGLDAIREAARIARERNMSPERLDELRNLAIACLALPDWRPLGPRLPLLPGEGAWDCDDQHRVFANADLHGHVTVRNVEDGALIAELKFIPGDLWPTFGPGGRFLMVHTPWYEHVGVWDLADSERPIVLERVGGSGAAFHPDGRHLVVTAPGGNIEQFDLIDPKQHSRILSNLGKESLQGPSFNPAGTKLAVIQQGTVRLVDARTGQLLGSIKETTAVERIAWHPSGDYVALVCAPRSIRIWDVSRLQRLSVLDGSTNHVIEIGFSADGELLASTGWEWKVRFWSWRTGQQVLAAPGHSNLRFGLGGRLMFQDGNHVELIEVAVSREYQSLGHGAGTEVECYGVAIDPSGRLLFAPQSDGLHLWDLGTAYETNFLDQPSLGHALLAFTGSDGLVTNGDAGLLYWPVRHSSSPGASLRIGPPQFRHNGMWTGVCSSADGQVVAQARGSEGTLVFFRDGSRPPVPLQPQSDVRYVDISPDGRFVAAGTHGGDGGVKVWEAASGRLLQALPVGSQAHAAFSPDGQWLAATGRTGGHILKVGTWANQCDLPWGDLAFSRDSRLLAVESGRGTLCLIDPATGRENVRLEDPNQDRANCLAFTPDSTRLVTCSNDGHAVHLWNLRLIRQELAKLDLDWDAPPYPAAPPPAPVERLQVEIVGSELIGNPRKMLEVELQTQAIRLFLDPLDIDAHFQFGRISLWLENTNEGLAELDAALALQPEHPGALALRSHLHFNNGRWQKAADDYTHILQRRPEELWARILRGDCYCSLGEAHKAVADYEECLRQGGDDWIVLSNLAWQLVGGPKDLRDPDRALPLLEKADRQSPGQYAVVQTLGVTYYRLGRFCDALTTLERAGKLQGPTPGPDVLYFLAMCRHQLGDVAGAKRDLASAIAANVEANLSPYRQKERQAFRAEAEELLREQR